MAQRVLTHVVAHPFVMWVNTFIGRYDTQIIIDARDAQHLQKIKDALCGPFTSKIQECTILTHLYDLEFTHLNPALDLGTTIAHVEDASFSSELWKRNFPVESSFSMYAYSQRDVELLSALSDDPRATLSDIAEKTNNDRQTVKSRIKKLIRSGVILNFGGIPNLRSLGFVTYYLLVRIAQGTPEKALKKPFRELRNIFYAGRMVGDCELILYLNARTPEELYSSISLFSKEVGGYILSYVF